MKRTSKNNIVLTLATILFFIAAFLFVAPSTESVAAEKKVYQWKLSSPVGPGTKGGAGFLRWYVKEVEKRTDGQLKLNIFWRNEINGPREMMMAVKNRLADMVLQIPAYTPGQTPMWNATWLPFLPPPRTDQSELLFNRLVKESKPIIAELERFNCIYVGAYDNEGYELIGKKPVRTVADLKGLRVRALPDTGKVLKDFGAVPVTVSASEMYSALDTGIVDVVAQGYNAFHAYRLDEISKYLILDIDLGGGATLLLINNDSWNELPDNLKRVLKSITDDFPAVMWDYTHQPELLAEFDKVIKERSIEVIRFPKSERDKIVEKAEARWEAWAKRSGNYAAAKQVLADYIRIRDEVVAQYPNGVSGIKNK